MKHSKDQMALTLTNNKTALVALKINKKILLVLDLKNFLMNHLTTIILKDQVLTFKTTAQ